MTKFPLLRVGYNNYRPRFWMNETNLPNEMSFEAVYINTFIGKALRNNNAFIFSSFYMIYNLEVLCG